MTELLVLNAREVEMLIDPDELLEGLRTAFRDLSAGKASVPPRTAAFSSKGLLGAMPGYLSEAGLAAKLVTVFPGNEELGMPSHQAVILLFDPHTGTPVALMDGTYITGMRTAASAVVAAKELACPESRSLTILGAGVQGERHLDAFSRAFDLTEVGIGSRNPSHADRLASKSPIARVYSSFEKAVQGADIVCCCTDSEEPILRREWIDPGTHVSSVGRGAEIDAQTIQDSSVFVEWRGAATNPPPAGATELQSLHEDRVVEIGEVLLGRKPGRISSTQITVYKSTGHAVEDAAAAAIALRAARAQRLGRAVSF